MIGNQQTHWVEHKLDQCIKLSLADMAQNKSMMIAAAYFWSDSMNAFLFQHGPATPTLADIHMLTGLDISSADDSTLLDRKPE